MTNRLVIDDLRNFRDSRVATYARTSQEALSIMATRTPFDEIWLDHDLGETPDGVVDSIMPVIQEFSFLGFENKHYPVTSIYVHTSNPVGAAQMMQALRHYGYNVFRVNAPAFFIVE